MNPRIYSVLCIIALLLYPCIFVQEAFAASKSSDIKALEKEIKLGKSVAEDIEKQWPRVLEPSKTARAEMILQRLRPYMERSLDYEVRVVEQKMVNAFSLPGGITYVTTGMLDFIKTDTELAAVIAHELVHADKRHVMVQVARNERLTLLAIAVAVATKGKGAAIIMANVAQVAIMNAYSIDLEKEADAGGIKAMMAAHFNPAGMLTLQERLLEESLRRPKADMGVWQSHPDAEERIRLAAQFMNDQKIPIHRKYALGLLRTEVQVASGDVGLMIDGEPLWSGKETADNREFLERVRARLDEYLQLETLPYDIRLQKESDGDVLRILARKIAEEREIPKGMEPLTLIPGRLQSALEKARKRYPVANYYL